MVILLISQMRSLQVPGGAGVGWDGAGDLLRVPELGTSRAEDPTLPSHLLL